MTVESHDLQLKYDDTVLAIHVYVRANQEIGKLQKNVIRAVKGPRLDACGVWTELYAPGRALGPEGDQFEENRPEVETFLRESTCAVVAVHAFVNTDSDPKRLAENVQRAARGPRLDALTIVVLRYDGEDGRKLWSVIQGAAARVAADPNVKPFSVSDEGP